MDVFISWSGERSRAVAVALKPWLEMVIQSVTVWISTDDIQAGARWAQKLSETLDKCNFGILCITSENVNAPWLVFEAGALSKSLDKASVVPLLYGLSEADLPFPLAQFQSVTADQVGVLNLVKALVAQLGNDGPEAERVLRLVENMWPVLETDWAVIPPPQEDDDPGEASRSDRVVLEEMLSILRNLPLGADSPIRKTPEERDENLAVTLRRQLADYEQRLEGLRASRQRHEERFNEVPAALAEEIERSSHRIDELTLALAALTSPTTTQEGGRDKADTNDSPSFPDGNS